MIDLIMRVFSATAREWRIGGELQAVTESDVRKALDEAASELYNREDGSTFTMGGLHIEKTRTGYDVYVHVGTYN